MEALSIDNDSSRRSSRYVWQENTQNKFFEFLPLNHKLYLTINYLVSNHDVEHLQNVYISIHEEFDIKSNICDHYLIFVF